MKDEVRNVLRPAGMLRDVPCVSTVSRFIFKEAQ